MEECDGGVASELSSETLQALLEFERKQGAVNLSHVTDLLLPEEEEEEVAEMPSEDWVTVWCWISLVDVHPFWRAMCVVIPTCHLVIR